MNLYIESLEGGSYLVATGNDKERHPLKKADGQPKAFHCLNEIRAHYEGTSFDKVWLRQATPYEEMVGLYSHASSQDMELNW